MIWTPAGSILLKTDWQFSEPVEGVYFKLKHSSFPVNNSYLVAQAQINLDGSVEIAEIQELKAGQESEVIYLKAPPVWSDRRLAIKRIAKTTSFASELRRVIRNDLLEDSEVEFTPRHSAWSVIIEASDYVEPTTQGSNGTTPPAAGTTLNWVTDGDTNGLFYYLGTNKLTQAFTNPVPTSVAVTASSVLNNDPAFVPSNLLDRTSSIFHSEGATTANSVVVDLGANRSLILNHYTYKGRGDANTNHPRSWNFQGSNNNTDWIDLDVQPYSTELYQNTYFSKPITEQTVKYRYFRFLQTGGNSSGNNHLNGQELEIYGTYFEI